MPHGISTAIVEPGEGLSGQARDPVLDWSEGHPAIYVVATTGDETRAALREAARYAIFAEADVWLVVLHEVPFPLPLDEPHVSPALLHAQFRELAASAGVEASVHLCLCRNQLDAPPVLFPKPSVVFVGYRRRWWPTREGRLIRLLRRLGHDVLAVGNVESC